MSDTVELNVDKMSKNEGGRYATGWTGWFGAVRRLARHLHDATRAYETWRKEGEVVAHDASPKRDSFHETSSRYFKRAPGRS